MSIDPIPTFAAPIPGDMKRLPAALRGSMVLVAMLVPVLGLVGDPPGLAPPSRGPLPGPRYVVLILADDLGKEQLAMYPGVAGMKARTPVLDSLAREGLVFDRTWSMPVCSPTRASLLTGRYPFRHGVTNIVPPKRTHGGLPTSEHTVFQELKARADGPFATAVMGKWHLGDAANGDMNSPARFGVERYIGIAGGSIEDPYSWNRHINGVKGLCSVYITTEITDQALAWTRGRETPWMLWLTEYAPHSPFVEPPPHLLDEHRLRSLCDDPSELLLGVAAIEAMDRELGRFFGGLSPEVRDRTLVLFLSDNGTSWEMVNDLEGKGRCKRTLYRPGIEVPMIVCGPQVRKGRTDLPVSVTDVYATLVEAMGGVLPKYQDSHSFWPVLLSRNGRNGRDQLFSERGPTSVPGGQVGWAMQVGRYKYMSLASGESHLFDLRRDPLEQSDLLNGQVTEKERALVDDFERRYAQLKAETL